MKQFYLKPSSTTRRINFLIFYLDPESDNPLWRQHYTARNSFKRAVEHVREYMKGQDGFNTHVILLDADMTVLETFDIYDDQEVLRLILSQP